MTQNTEWGKQYILKDCGYASESGCILGLNFGIIVPAKLCQIIILSTDLRRARHTTLMAQIIIVEHDGPHARAVVPLSVAFYDGEYCRGAPRSKNTSIKLDILNDLHPRCLDKLDLDSRNAHEGAFRLRCGGELVVACFCFHRLSDLHLEEREDWRWWRLRPQHRFQPFAKGPCLRPY